MLKRRSESKEDRWRRKMKKYEEKLWAKGRVLHPSDDDQPQDEPGYTYWDRPPTDLESPTPPANGDDELAEPECAHDKVAEPECAHDKVAEPECVQPPAAEEPAEALDEEIDPELLQALGAFDAETAEWGEDINCDLARRWEPILKDGMKKEVKDELLKKYLYAQNCPLLKPPILNPEIEAMLNESSKNRDLRIVKKQGQLGCALTVLGKAMTGILTKKIGTSDMLRLISEASKLIADSHFTESETRRALITPMVDKSLMDPFKNRKRDSHLFGDKLSDFIKTSRGIKKTGQLIQPTSTSTGHLNWKGPLPRQQQHQRAPRAQPSRVSGPRPPLPPPPPAYRRRAPPPGPPARRAPMMSQPQSAAAPQPYRQQQAPAPRYRH